MTEVGASADASPCHSSPREEVALASRFPTSVVLFSGAFGTRRAAVDAHVDRREGRGQAVWSTPPGRRRRRCPRQRRGGRGGYRGGRPLWPPRATAAPEASAAVDQHPVLESEDVGKPCPGGRRDRPSCRPRSTMSESRHVSDHCMCLPLIPCAAGAASPVPNDHLFILSALPYNGEIGSGSAAPQGRKARNAAAGAALRGLHEAGNE